MAKRNDFYHDGSILGKTAAEQLDLETITRDDTDMCKVRAEAGAIRAAEGAGVKKTVATFRDGFVTAFVRVCENRKREALEAAKPVFYGTRDSMRAAWDQKDTRLWTLCSVVDDVKSKQKDVVNHLESIIRDATRMRDRITAQLETEVINEKLYPTYDENLGQMGIRVDTASAALRTLQESARTMIGLMGMRLPTIEELRAAGLVKEEEEAK